MSNSSKAGWTGKPFWDRPCKIGAVGSVVIKIKGMQLKVQDGWIDRINAAHQVKAALMTGAAKNDALSESMLDIVCSKATDEGTIAGASRVSCTFYLRLPAFMGLVAKDHWIPRINKMHICNCPVEAYLLFGEGK